MIERIVRRLGHVGLALLRASDIVLCTLWIAPLYLIGLASRPTGTEMISSYVGEAAHNGRLWAFYAARAIDRLMEWLGDGPDHCRRSWLKYQIADDHHAG